MNNDNISNALASNFVLAHFTATAPKMSATNKDLAKQFDNTAQCSKGVSKGTFDIWQSPRAKAHIQKIKSIIATAREYHYKMTLPYGTNVSRSSLKSATGWLSTDAFFQYQKFMGERQKEMIDALDELQGVYPLIKADSIADLGEYLRGKDINSLFPDFADFREQFSFTTTITTVPKQDWDSVALPSSVVAELSETAVAQEQEMAAGAIKAAFLRVIQPLEAIIRATTAPVEEGGKQKPVHKSLWENMSHCIAQLDTINVFGDKELYKATQLLKDLISTFDIDDVKGAACVREDMHHKANEVKEKLKGLSAMQDAGW